MCLCAMCYYDTLTLPFTDMKASNAFLIAQLNIYKMGYMSIKPSWNVNWREEWKGIYSNYSSKIIYWFKLAYGIIQQYKLKTANALHYIPFVVPQEMTSWENLHTKIIHVFKAGMNLHPQI